MMKRHLKTIDYGHLTIFATDRLTKIFYHESIEYQLILQSRIEEMKSKLDKRKGALIAQKGELLINDNTLPLIK